MLIVSDRGTPAPLRDAVSGRRLKPVPAFAFTAKSKPAGSCPSGITPPLTSASSAAFQKAPAVKKPVEKPAASGRNAVQE